MRFRARIPAPALFPVNGDDCASGLEGLAVRLVRTGDSAVNRERGC